MSKKNKTHEFEYILNLLSCYQREHKELTFSELLNEILENKNLKDCSNKELEDLIKSKIDEDKAKKLVFQPIKHYKLNENISIDFLKSLGFRDGGFFSEIENPKMNYYQRLDGDIEFHFEINTNTFEFNDFDNILILDDSFCQPYQPFYDKQEKVFPYCAKIRKKYNELMDDFIKKGLLIEIK